MVVDIPKTPPSVDCGNHVKVRYVVATQDMATKKYDIDIYTFCNNCAVKLDQKIMYTNSNNIPEIEKDCIIKVLCKVISNGEEYAQFGYSSDWRNWQLNAEYWQ